MPGKELVTEADVRRMARGGELVLGPDRIATPAALDAAFERGVRIVHAGAGSASAIASPNASTCGTKGCGCGGPGKCLWSQMKAQDGTYIVEVRGGRAVVTRLGSTGPESFGSE